MINAEAMLYSSGLVFLTLAATLCHQHEKELLWT